VPLDKYSFLSFGDEFKDTQKLQAVRGSVQLPLDKYSGLRMEAGVFLGLNRFILMRFESECQFSDRKKMQ
jgi:hypothetical protein